MTDTDNERQVEKCHQSLR